MTQTQQTNLLTTKFGQEAKDYVVSAQFGYMPQDWKTPTTKQPVGNTTNNGYRMNILIGTNDTIVSEDSTHISFKSPSRRVTVMIGGKRVYEQNHFIRTVRYDNGSYSLEIFSTQEENFYKRNIDFLKKAWPTYVAFCTQKTGIENPDDAQVIKFMATDHYDFEYKELLYVTSDLTVDIEATAESADVYRIKLTPRIKGVEHTANRFWCQLQPKSPVAGLPNTLTNRAVGSGFATEREFFVTTNFNLRGDYAYVMSSGDFEFYTQADCVDAVGNKVQCITSKVINLSLTEYDYFGLK